MKTFEATGAVCLLLFSVAHSWILMENANSDEDFRSPPPPPPNKVEDPMITKSKLQYGAEMFGHIATSMNDPGYMQYCAVIKKKAPIDYDVRDKFPKCSSLINEMERQGPCNSSWATTTASVLTDRYCVQSVKAKKTMSLGAFSAYDLMTCGSDETAWDESAPQPIQGCKGGSVLKAWQYMENHGVVTGGAFQSEQGCQPNKVDPIGSAPKNPRCEEKCVPSYKGNYFVEKDQVRQMLSKNNSFGFQKLACRVQAADSTQIQLEISEHGPVAAVMLVCTHLFEHNSEKVYERLDKSLEDCEGYAAVKIVGWGHQTERDEVSGEDVLKKFWTVQGPWGKNFGNAGFVKVLREPKKCWQNGCIEMRVSAPNFVFNKRTFYKGPWPLDSVINGKAPHRPQDFTYVGY